jgi:hypothetical protein
MLALALLTLVPADGGEPGLGPVELARDPQLDVALEWRVGEEDEVPDDGPTS